MTEFISLQEAASFLRDSQTLALGGMALYRRPVAFVRELLRRSQRPHDMTLLAFTAGYAADLLVGAGVVSRVRTVYFGLEVFGLAPMFTRMAGNGQISVIEETETSIVLGLRATVQGIDHMPSTAWQGTDLLNLREDVSNIEAPYSGETLTAFPAIPVNVAVIHALEADREGNIAINNNLGIDQLLVYASNTIIVTTEKIVETLVPSPQKTIIPAPGINYVCEAPGGAKPTSCYPNYTIQGRVFADYVERCTDETAFAGYLAELMG